MEEWLAYQHGLQAPIIRIKRIADVPLEEQGSLRIVEIFRHRYELFVEPTVVFQYVERHGLGSCLRGKVRTSCR